MLCTLSLCLGGDPLFMWGAAAVDGLASLTDTHRKRVLMARLQVALPETFGGMGVTPLDLIHPAAYVASWLETLRFLHAQEPAKAPLLSGLVEGVDLKRTTVQPLCELRLAWRTMVDFMGGDATALLKSLRVKSFSELASSKIRQPQRKLSVVLGQRQFHNLKLAAALVSEDDRRRLISCSGAGAAAWLRAAPIGELQLSDLHWRLAANFWLGLPLACLGTCVDSLCSPTCQFRPDNMGHHEQACHHISKWPRHEAIVDVILWACKQAGVEGRLWSRSRAGISPELLDLLGDRMADLFLPDFRGIGLNCHLDMTVIHPLLRAYADIDYTSPGDAVTFVRALAKYGLYCEFDHTRQELFIVFGAESYGAFSPDSVRFLNDFIIRAYVTNRGVNPDSSRGVALATKFRSQVFTRLSVAIHRANANCVIKAVQRRHPLNFDRLLKRVAAPAPPTSSRKRQAQGKRRARRTKKTRARQEERVAPWLRDQGSASAAGGLAAPVPAASVQTVD